MSAVQIGYLEIGDKADNSETCLEMFYLRDEGKGEAFNFFCNGLEKMFYGIMVYLWWFQTGSV